MPADLDGACRDGALSAAACAHLRRVSFVGKRGAWLSLAAAYANVLPFLALGRTLMRRVDILNLFVWIAAALVMVSPRHAGAAHVPLAAISAVAVCAVGVLSMRTWQRSDYSLFPAIRMATRQPTDSYSSRPLPHAAEESEDEEQ